MKFKFLEYEIDKNAVTAFLIKNDSYLIYQDGKPINAGTTQEVFYGELPPNKSYDDKQIIGFYEEEILIGVVDLLKNYPIKDTWVIGLLLLDEKKRGQKMGTKMFKEMEHFMLMHAVKTIRLGVLEDNEIGIEFWESNGFVKNGASKLHEDGRAVFVYEKEIATR